MKKNEVGEGKSHRNKEWKEERKRRERRERREKTGEGGRRRRQKRGKETTEEVEIGVAFQCPPTKRESTPSKDVPLVSGRKKKMKTQEPTQKLAKSQKVPAWESAPKRVSSVDDTMRLAVQLEAPAIPEAFPLTESGKISDMTAQGTGPMATAKQAT